MGMMIALILFFVAIYGLITRKNIIKTIIAFGIMESAIILYYLSANHEPNAVAPLALQKIASGTPVADPLPQAMMITSIVIGISVTAVGLTMFMSLYYHYGTTNWAKVAQKRKEEK